MFTTLSLPIKAQRKLRLFLSLFRLFFKKGTHWHSPDLPSSVFTPLCQFCSKEWRLEGGYGGGSDHGDERINCK